MKRPNRLMLIPGVAPNAASFVAVLGFGGFGQQQARSEVIRFGHLDGLVSLARRPPADYGSGDVSTSGITLQQLVDTCGVLPPAPITTP